MRISLPRPLTQRGCGCAAIVDKLLCRKWDERVEAFGMVKRTVEKRVVELRAAGDVEEATRLFRAACKIAERGVHDKVPPVYLAAIDVSAVGGDLLRRHGS